MQDWLCKIEIFAITNPPPRRPPSVAVEERGFYDKERSTYFVTFIIVAVAVALSIVINYILITVLTIMATTVISVVFFLSKETT